MKKILLISAVLATGVVADMMTDMAKDVAMSKAKTEVRNTAVKHVAGNDPIKKEVANKVADEVLGKESPMDKMKSDVLSSVTGSGSSTPDVGSLVGGAKKETSMTDKATDMAVEKAVGTNPLKKAAAKEALKSVM
jgi:hypothetical protein